MKQWAIVVGLNEHQLFQPLSCARQDAQALHQFLIQQAGFPSEQCILLTNTSPPMLGRSTQPTRTNLQAWMDMLSQHYWKPGDALWFFFSGYGVCHQGNDYLVPFDGNPSAIETTGLSVNDLFNCFKASLPFGNLFMALDISRSQGSISYATVGIQTAQLASQLGIPTLLSCQPGQFSREVSSLGHGLFTHALLEALRHDPSISLAMLTHYLRDRLPELSEHYWQPSQYPVVIAPADTLNQSLLVVPPGSPPWQEVSIHSNSVPIAEAVRGAGQYSTPVAVPVAAGGAAVEHNGVYSQGALMNGHASAAATVLERDGASLSNGAANGTEAIASNSVANGSQSRSQPLPASPALDLISADTELQEENPLRFILLWGGLLSLGLIGCVLWRNWGTIWAANPAIIPGTPVPAIADGAAYNALTGRASPSLGTLPLQPGSANVSGAGTLTTTPSNVTAPTVPTASPAQSQILNFNPATNASTPMPPSAPAGTVILAQARAMILSDQATPYRDAILAAKQIQPNDPVYAEAQQDIATWSQVIFNLAQQRAQQQKWDIAIMAADLVPADHPTLYPKAQAAIAQWCSASHNLKDPNVAQVQAKEICSR